MRLEGTCKIHSRLGVEYQFGEFFVHQACLVFEQKYSFGGKKRKIFPLKKMEVSNLQTNEKEDLLTFSCDNLEFELDSSVEGDLLDFAEEIQDSLALSKKIGSELIS